MLAFAAALQRCSACARPSTATCAVRVDEALVRAVIAHAERTPEPRRLTAPLEASVRASRRRAARARGRGG